MDNKMTAADRKNARFQFNNLEDFMWYLDNYGNEYIKHWIKDTGYSIVFSNKDICYSIYPTVRRTIEICDKNTNKVKWTYKIKKGSGYDYGKAMYLVYRTALEVFGKNEAAEIFSNLQRINKKVLPLQQKNKKRKELKMETVKFRVPEPQDLFDDPSFIEYIRKVVKGKAVIHLESNVFKRVFNIVCNDRETIYLNRNAETVTRYDRSHRIDYLMTANWILLKAQNICEGFEEEVI